MHQAQRAADPGIAHRFDDAAQRVVLIGAGSDHLDEQCFGQTDDRRLRPGSLRKHLPRDQAHQFVEQGCPGA